MPRGDGSRRGERARSGPSGPSIPNAQRSTKQVLLRLPPDAVDLLAALCARWECGRSEAVTDLLRAEASETAAVQLTPRGRAVARARKQKAPG